MATDINTLADRCGVSKATISRVFTGRARVSEEVRRRVLAAARELNYRPQQVMARDCVAIIIDHFLLQQKRLGFTDQVLSAAILEITRRNLLTEVLSGDDLAKLYDGYTRAVLLLLSEPEIEKHLTELKNLSMPILTVNKRYPFSSSVNTDHGEGVLLALRHLAELGHRRIGLTLDRFENQAGIERQSAYREFITREKLPELEVVHYCDETRENSGDNLRRLLSQKPTALIVCGEAVALLAVHELKELGYRIPQDLSVITSELAGVSEWQNPEMTTIDQDLNALAAETVAQLLARVKNPHLPRSDAKFDSRLIVRASTAAPPAATGH